MRHSLLLLAAGIMAVVAVFASGKSEALLLSCMDYRLVDDTERYMSGRGLRDKYDHVILAGASLGVVSEKYPSWSKTFWEHLEVAIQSSVLPVLAFRTTPPRN